MLLTTSDCTPTLLCLQACEGDLSLFDVPGFERMYQVASTGLEGSVKRLGVMVELSTTVRGSTPPRKRGNISNRFMCSAEQVFPLNEALSGSTGGVAEP